jgi:Fic-DOC domain mobile mystery protein B
MGFTYPDGATPFDHDAKLELIPALTTQKQLNAFEQANISVAIEWAIKSRTLKATLVTVEGVTTLHKKMFSQTWRWAGRFRRKELNIGVEWIMIPEQLKALCDDVSYWTEHAVFEPTEIAVRFHHRLVQIHPFPNGNGRLNRLVADLFLQYRKRPSLTLGGIIDLNNNGPDRREYIASLREADVGGYGRLIRFATRGE